MLWLRKSWLWLAGALALAAFAMLGRDGRRLRKAEDKEQRLLAEGSSKARAKAIKMNAKAETLKAQAAEAAEVGKIAIDGVKDEKLQDIISAWSKPGT